MNQNIIAIPPELYKGDLPRGYQCTLYVGRMVGKLSSLPNAPSLQEFKFEISAVNDNTEMALCYLTYGAPAGELARWENASDTVGIVIAHKGKHMDMLLAYNFNRRKWFATGYYPHVKDLSPASRVSVENIRQGFTLSMVAIALCGLGLIALPFLMFLSLQKHQQFKVLNPTNYRGKTALKIANWITAQTDQVLPSASPAYDPSL
jgi:hypothetical protein